MRTTHRRYWVFFLLLLFSGIAYLDRVNMSVAGKPIAREFGLSPVALGYLFSSFLWAYVLMMLPGGRLIDRWGTHVVASVAAAVWSTAQMATGMAGNFEGVSPNPRNFRHRRFSPATIASRSMTSALPRKV
jgi:MFS family permease